jgi:hypothetical protein
VPTDQAAYYIEQWDDYGAIPREDQQSYKALSSTEVRKETGFRERFHTDFSGSDMGIEPSIT